MNWTRRAVVHLYFFSDACFETTYRFLRTTVLGYEDAVQMNGEKMSCLRRLFPVIAMQAGELRRYARTWKAGSSAWFARFVRRA